MPASEAQQPSVNLTAAYASPVRLPTATRGIWILHQFLRKQIHSDGICSPVLSFDVPSMDAVYLHNAEFDISALLRVSDRSI